MVVGKRKKRTLVVDFEAEARSIVRRLKVLEEVACWWRRCCMWEIMAKGRETRGKKWRKCGEVGMSRVSSKFGKR